MESMRFKMLEIELIEKQFDLLSCIDLRNSVNIATLNTVAGVDVSYWRDDNGKEIGACCIVLIDFRTKNVIDKKYIIDYIKVPYIPGCLGFREVPLVLKAIKLFNSDIDLFVFDGNGYLHPRHMGLATHAGILLNKPSIGVAKSYYRLFDRDYPMPDNAVFAYQDIVCNSEVYGRVLRTKKNVNPIFLSIGNKIDLETATEIIKRLMGKESRIPIPTRLADLYTHEIKNKNSN